jgi:NAD(P)H dehydrogenase (quinone)
MSMEKVLVTGATGQLGSRIVQQLLRKMPAASIVAGGRKAEKAQKLVEQGVEFRPFDYDAPASLDAALAGVARVVLVSGTDVGRRVPQHGAVIDAALRAGVKLLAYTSILRATESPLLLAAEHRGTEELLAARRLPYILLRHGWYNENNTNSAKLSIQHGVVQTSAGDGRFSTASRDDYAEADATLILRGGHEPGQRYELAGSTSFTKQEYAELLSRKSGSKVACMRLTQEEHKAALEKAGLPPPVADIISNSDANAGKGWLFDDSRTLEKVIGRPTTTIEQSLDAALAAQ